MKEAVEYRVNIMAARHMTSRGWLVVNNIFTTPRAGLISYSSLPAGIKH
jgi:hypothetical protein